MTVLLLAAPILMALTLLVSGLAKLGTRQGTQDAMTSLRIPARPLHPLVANLLPAGEVVLALALWIPLWRLQIAVAVLILLLVLAYLVIIARALTFDEQVDCSCFGTLASPTVTRSTLGRNIILTLLAALTLIAAISGILTITVVQAPLYLVIIAAVLLLTVLLTVLTLGGLESPTTADPAATPAPAAPVPSPAAPGPDAPGTPLDRPGVVTDEEPGEDGLLDYERTPIPAAILQRPDGSLISLDRLTIERAALLVFATEGCGPCERVLDHAEEWIEDLSPYLQVRFVFSRPKESLRERTAQRVGDAVLHDHEFTTRTALGARGAPSAVLLGADGLLAGGPVTGGDAVIDFVTEMQEQISQAREDGELP
ncbi:MauE/DoxX family redox-associated membrane protein [Brachybacterium sp. Marseille-Q7125]|uniref:MauE/DoxX family redox-associated membrane protein n=1 Tax=Brachybacterium sp. Marseille-Q7125 TaxID=2932815 RepID=UPI001FF6815A|nr:MauE/DoxX family redox-associated membrane protein [Brachybacterium sp. Marseille-Q7125]